MRTPETAVAAMRRHAAARPDHPALHLLGEGNDIAATWSRAMLERRIRAVAAALVERHLPAGACAVALYPEGPDFVAAFMGCLSAGVIAAPAPFPGSLKSTQDARRLDAILADVRPALILTTWAGNAFLDGATPVIMTDALDPIHGDGWTPPAERDGVAYLQYTSGSTAAPRGIAITHDNLSHSLADLHRVWGYDADSAALTWMPHVHDYGLVEGLMRPLTSGVTCTLLSPRAFVRRPIRWLQAIGRYRITHSGGATFAYDWCVRQVAPAQRRDLDLHTWRFATIGAEPIPPSTIERFADAFGPFGFERRAFCPGYGLGESTLVVAAKPAGLDPTVREVTLGTRRVRMTGCGRPPGYGRMAIVDPITRRRCGPGEVGEIWTSGPTVAAGYWQRPEDSRECFDARLADSDEGPFLRTGDLGVVDQGDLFVTGRLKDLLIVHGQNLHPQDVEWALAGCHPACEHHTAAAFGVTTGDGEELAIAHEVDPRRWPETTWPSVMEAIRQRVAERFELPVHGIVLLRRSDVPKTSSGKLRRSACRDAYRDGTWAPLAAWRRPERSDGGPSLPADAGVSDVAAGISAIWQECLKTPVRPRDNFFALGGDSLTALTMTMRVEERFGVRVPPEYFRDPTVERLAGLVAGEPDALAGLAQRHERAFRGADRSPRQRLWDAVVDTGPVWNGHALPYAVGIRLQKAWLAVPGVGSRLRRRASRVLSRWGALIGEPPLDAAIQVSLLTNTWRQWRSRALGVPPGASPWVTYRGHPPSWHPHPEGLGTVYLVLHTPLSRIFMNGLRASGRTAVEIRRDVGEWDTRVDDRTVVFHRAYDALLRGDVVFVAGDGGKGRKGVLMPFYGGQRLFRFGAAELAVRTRARLVPVFCDMDVDGHVTIDVLEPLVIPDGPREAAVEAATRRYAALALERWPELHPALNWRHLEVWLERLKRGRT